MRYHKLTSGSTLLSPKGVGGLFWAGSLWPTVLSLFMEGGLAVVHRAKERISIRLQGKRLKRPRRSVRWADLVTCCWRSCSTETRMWWRSAGRGLSWTPCPLGPAGREFPARSPPPQMPAAEQMKERKGSVRHSKVPGEGGGAWALKLIKNTIWSYKISQY